MRRAEFKFFFAEAEAEAAARSLAEVDCLWRPNGSEIRTSSTAGRCARQMVLTVESLEKVYKEFVAVAKRHGGVFYGWDSGRRRR